jgi:hypothetical protein
VKNRRSLTPSTSHPAGGVHATRRGGARVDASARVSLKGTSGEVLEGWALNVSRGGVRVILEERVELGAEFEVTLIPATEIPTPGAGRIVWVQEEPDGVVAGIEFCSPSISDDANEANEANEAKCTESTDGAGGAGGAGGTHAAPPSRDER